MPPHFPESQEEMRRFVGRWIHLINKQIKLQMNEKLKTLGLGSGMFNVFFELMHNEEGIRQEELARRLQVDKGTITRAVTKLEGDGLLLREKDLEDKRAWRLFITEKGRDLKPQLAPIMMSMMETLVTGLSIEEQELLGNLLEKVWENAVEMNRDID